MRARAELISVEELGDGWWHVVTKFTVEGEGQDKPVCVAEAVGPRADRLEAPLQPYLTVSVPFMPAASCPSNAAEVRVRARLQVDVEGRLACR